MMRDFTLVIPTCNRVQLLAALLSYLETEKADCRILVLDSSRPDALAANRARVASSSLDVELLEFPDLEPNEKRRQGIRNVRTPFCALCADSGLVILEGVRCCLDALRDNPMASVAQGYSFTFTPRPDGDMELNDIVCFEENIDDQLPLARLGRFFPQYRAPIEGVFRTRTLQRIFDTLQPITRALARELLWSALTIIEGQLVSRPEFSYGRSIRPSAAYEIRNPLEWFCKDPDSLFAEYLRYREVLAAALMRQPDNDLQRNEVYDLLDLIHLRYLAHHAPDAVLEFITERQISGLHLADHCSPDRLPLPPYAAADIGARARSAALGRVTVRGRERSYVLSSNFCAPPGFKSPQLESVVHLIDSLDCYRPVPDGKSAGYRTI
jgi:glycosyltransferase domain-containing protein